MQYGHTVEMQHGHAARACNVGMRHEHAAWHTVWTCSMYILHGQAAWACCTDMQHGRGAWTQH
jgi:hypothetical protein